MRLYKRAIKIDMMDTINRCYLDADQSRIKLALDRLEDLELELGEQPRIFYAEGMLRKDLLGQGVLAFGCFAKALKLDPNYSNAACNAAGYAPNEVEFRAYNKIAARLSPPDRQIFTHQVDLLNQGIPYWQIILPRAISVAKENTAYASLIDVALASGTIPRDKELEYRQKRFQILRNQDKLDQSLRESMAEEYPPEERLALFEALNELEKAIILDRYEATFWNFRAAWKNLLRQYDEAILSADEAIRLRPNGYYHPYHNKAIALSKLGKINDAKACAEEAILQMKQIGDEDDLKIIQELVDDLHYPDHSITWAKMLQVITDIMEACHLKAQQEWDALGGHSENKRMSLKQAEILFKNRIYNLQPNPNNALHYVPSMAHLLTYFSPELCCEVLQELQKTDMATFENCMLANLYISAHGEAIMRHDSLRLNIFTYFAETIKTGNQKILQDQYRKSILNVSVAATDEMCHLDQLMRKELQSIHPDLPIMIANQEPSNDEEIIYAQNVILSRLQGTPYVIDANQFGLNLLSIIMPIIN
jgi:tetratricopeptide (TPR) repeat protein